MNKQIISMVSLIMISGSIALAQQQPSKTNSQTLVATPAAEAMLMSNQDKQALNDETPRTATKLPEGEKGSEYEMVDSEAREKSAFHPGMKPRSKADKMKKGLVTEKK